MSRVCVFHQQTQSAEMEATLSLSGDPRAVVPGACRALRGSLSCHFLCSKRTVVSGPVEVTPFAMELRVASVKTHFSRW